MSAKAQPSSQESDAVDPRFADLATKLCQLAKLDGLELRPFDHPTTPFFLELTEAGRLATLRQLEQMIVVCESVRTAGRSVRNSVALLWAYFKHSGFTPPSDFEQKIEAEDVAEIYNDFHQLIFANLRFFELSSNTLEELYCRQWQDLLERSSENQSETERVCKSMVSGGAKGAVDMSYLGPHRLSEKTGKKRFGEVNPRWIAPLNGEGGTRAYICINKASLFGALA